MIKQRQQTLSCNNRLIDAWNNNANKYTLRIGVELSFHNRLDNVTSS